MSYPLATRRISQNRAARIRELERDVFRPIEPQGRAMTAREQARWEELLAEIDQLDARLAALVKTGAVFSSDTADTALALRDKRLRLWQEAKCLLQDCMDA